MERGTEPPPLREGELARLRDESRESAQLLGVLAHMGEAPVPGWALAAGHGALPDPLAASARAGAERVTAAAAPLVERGWVETDDGSLRLDPGVAEAVRARMSGRERGSFGSAAVAVLHRAFPERVGRGGDRRRCRALEPHVREATEHPGAGGRSTAEAIHVLARLAAFLRSEEDGEAALAALRSARRLAGRGDPVDDAFRAVLADETASLLAGLDRPEEARETAEAARVLAEEGLEPGDPRLPILLSNLGTTFRELELHERAAGCLERALSLAEASGSRAARPLAVELRASLADVHLAAGRYEAAEAAARAALEAAEELSEAPHPQAARASWMLGDALRESGRGEEAVAAYRSSLTMEQELHGQAHPGTGQKALGLGLHLEELGRTEEAEEAFRTALTAFRASLGEASEAARSAHACLDRVTGGG